MCLWYGGISCTLISWLEKLHMTPSKLCHSIESWMIYSYMYKIHEWVKFPGSRAIVGLVPSCLCGPKIFSRGYFMGPKYILVGISWVSSIFLWVFRGSKLFFRRCFVCPKFFVRVISWVKNFFSWVFCRSKILWFSINFSNKQKETYGWGILTKRFKLIAFTMDFS